MAPKVEYYNIIAELRAKEYSCAEVRQGEEKSTFACQCVPQYLQYYPELVFSGQGARAGELTAVEFKFRAEEFMSFDLSEDQE